MHPATRSRVRQQRDHAWQAWRCSGVQWGRRVGGDAHTPERHGNAGSVPYTGNPPGPGPTGPDVGSRVVFEVQWFTLSLIGGSPTLSRPVAVPLAQSKAKMATCADHI